MKHLFTITCIIMCTFGNAMTPRTAKILKYGGAAFSPVLAGTAWQMVRHEEIFDGWRKGICWGLYPVRNFQMAGVLPTDSDRSICVCTKHCHQENNDRLFRTGFAGGLLTSCVTMPIAMICALRSPRVATIMLKKV